MKEPELTPEHEWLLQLVGDWTFEHAAPPTEGQPPGTIQGTETFRALGNTWVQGEALSHGLAAVFFLVSRGLAIREGINLEITDAGRAVGKMRV